MERGEERRGVGEKRRIERSEKKKKKKKKRAENKLVN